jgi:hypothetical protein
VHIAPGLTAGLEYYSLLTVITLGAVSISIVIPLGLYAFFVGEVHSLLRKCWAGMRKRKKRDNATTTTKTPSLPGSQRTFQTEVRAALSEVYYLNERTKKGSTVADTSSP